MIKKKSRKNIVEDCFAIKIADLRDGPFLKQKGSLRLSAHDETMNVSYELLGDVLYAEYNETEQSVAIEKKPALRGVAYFFLCSCGRRCKKLYLSPGREDFICRQCGNLSYQSCRISDSTKNGAILNDYCRMLKLIEKRENIRSVFYAGKFTSRFNKLLEYGTKQGFKGWVAEQREGMDKIRQMNTALNEARGGR